MQNNKNQSMAHQKHVRENHSSFENILDEYKILSLQLFEQAGVVTESDVESTSLSFKQAELLDKQQALLTGTQSMELKNNKDIIALLQLWKSEEVYNDDVTPSQGLVLHLLKHFENTLV